jgi:CBS domain-containing protein
MTVDIAATLASTHPYDVLPEDDRAELALAIDSIALEAGETLYSVGDPQTHLYLIVSGRIDITDPEGAVLSILGPRNSFGERGPDEGRHRRRHRQGIRRQRASAHPRRVLPRADGRAPARPAVLRSHATRRTRKQDITTIALSELMTRDPLTCGPTHR